MWIWTALWLAAAVLAGLFALGSIHGPALVLGKAAFFVFLALFVISLIADLAAEHRLHRHAR